jgi:hypothetical protein
MALPKLRFAEVCEAGDAWLADGSAHPALVRAAWDEEVLAPIGTGPHWLAAQTQLVAAMYALTRIREEHRGPVLADTALDKAWWLVPADADEEFADLGQVFVQPSGWPLRCPPTGLQLEGRFWLNRPDGSGQLNEPALLGAALGPSVRHPREAFEWCIP